MKVAFNVAGYNTSECSDKIVHLSWISAANRIGNPDSVDTNLIDCLVDGEKVDKVGTEGVF